MGNSASEKIKLGLAAAGAAASMATSPGTDLLKSDTDQAAERQRNTAEAQLRDREAETARTLRTSTTAKGQPTTSGR